MNTPDIIEHLKVRFQQKRDNHPSFKLMKIDNSLFPNGIIIPFETEAKDSDNKLRTVKDIVAASWKKGEKNHLMIQGEGGIGKTVTLLSLPVMFNNNFVPAIYISLHELRGDGTDDMIEGYIKKRVLDEDEELFRQLKELRNQEWNNKPSLLLLLDGFNEISNELRGAISEKIEQWSEYYPGVQIITASRFDIHQYVYLRSGFSKIELQPLSEDTVLTYLENNGIDTPKSSVITKLITIPLLLTLYIKTAAIRREQPAPFAKFMETKNAGTLVWNYLQSELWRFRKNSQEGVSCVFAMEYIAPYIAWQMQKKSSFALNEEEYYFLLDNAYNLIENHFNRTNDFPSFLQEAIQYSNGLPKLDSIRNLLEEQICLFVNEGNHYRLMYQQFRDALAAIHLINSIYLNGNNRPVEWNSTVDHYVLWFVADLISEDEAKRLWEQNRTSPQLETATRNQLELQRRLLHCDFSELNFSGLDLSNISLYPFRYNNVTIKLPTDSDSMHNTEFSEKTFFAGGPTDWVDSVAVTPNGKQVINGSRDGIISIWDMDTGELVRTLKGHKNWVRSVAVTLDGKKVVSGSNDCTICIWDLETGVCIKTIKGHKHWVTAVAVTSDGKYIVSGSFDCAIRVWDMETGICLKTLEGHEKGINAVAITPNSKCVISGSNDCTINIWDMETGVLLRKFIEQDWVNAVAVSPDWKRIVSGSFDNAIRVWNLETDGCLKTLEGHTGSVNAVAMTTDGKRIVSGSDDCTLRVWDLDTGACLKTLEGHTYGVNALAVTSDDKRIVSGSGDQTIRVWDLETGLCLKTEGQKYGLNAMAVTSDGRRVVSGSLDSTIRVWDMETGVCLKTLDENMTPVNAVAVTSDGKRIVSGSGDKNIRVWDMETGACLKTMEGQGGWVNVVAVTTDGKHVISGSGDHTIRVWDMENGECLKTFEGHESWVNSVAVTTDGSRIVSGSGDNTIRLWDMDTGACLKTLDGHESWVNSVAVTTDGSRIVSGSGDHTIRVWDMESGECLKTLVGHRSWVNVVALTLDGSRIVSGSGDHAIRVWDMESGECLKTLKGHISMVNAVALTSDGKRIVSGSWDNTIRIWDLESGECLTTIRIHPLSFIGLDFSKAIVSSPELKEQLRQNGAKV